jgi:shikimate kinase
LVYLKASPASLRTRLQGDTSRPLWGADFEDRLRQRSAAYEQADLVVLTDDRSPAEIGALILRSLAA